MKMALGSQAVDVLARRVVAAVASLLLMLPGVCSSVTLTTISSDVVKNNDKNCFPSVWVPTPSWPDIFDGYWLCLQGNTEDSAFVQVADTAFKIESFASVGTVVVGESWVAHDYTHHWQVGLDGPAGSTSDAWLYAAVDGAVSVYALGVGVSEVRASASLRLWQGAFEGWGYYVDPIAGSTRYGPVRSDGVVPDPNLTVGWGANAFGLFAWWDEDEVAGSYHEPLGLELTAGDPTTDLWIEASFETNAKAAALYVPPWGLGTGGAEVDLALGDKGFRYGLGLDSAPPAGWSEVRAVPEPTTVVLFGLGLAGLAAARRGKPAASAARQATDPTAWRIAP